MATTRASTLTTTLVALGTSAPNLVAFRSGALAALREAVPHDAALFHALSPRVPLATAAHHGIDLLALAGSQKSWDDLAVELGALRDTANRQWVADLDSVYAPQTKRHRQIVARLQALFGMRSLCILHLIVREQVGSAVVLLAKRSAAFTAQHRELLRAVCPVLALSDRLQEQLDGVPRTESPVALRCVDERLTERQREIVERVALGHSNAQIATGLALSANTIRNHLARVFERIGASNRADLVRLAVLRPAQPHSS